MAASTERAPISASMKAKTWSCDRFSVLQMSPKLMITYARARLL